jgi:hypothetical protein
LGICAARLADLRGTVASCGSGTFGGGGGPASHFDSTNDTTTATITNGIVVIPRKLDRQMEYASPLHAISSTSSPAV